MAGPLAMAGRCVAQPVLSVLTTSILGMRGNYLTLLSPTDHSLNTPAAPPPKQQQG